MESNQGFIVIHRQILHSSVFTDPIVLKTWMWCLLRANHKPTEIILGGQIIQLDRGQFVTGIHSACAELSLTPSVYRRAISALEGSGRIRKKSTNKFTIISIVKYDYFQSQDKKSTNKQQTNNKQKTTDNNDNNDNNELGETSSPGLKANKENMFDKSFREEPTIDYDGDGSLVEEKKKSTRKYPNAPAIRKVFQEVLGRNPANWRINKNQLQACENLYTERTVEKVRSALEFYKEHEGQEFCPTIHSPYDLDTKWTKLGEFKLKKQWTLKTSSVA